MESPSEGNGKQYNVMSIPKYVKNPGGGGLNNLRHLTPEAEKVLSQVEQKLQDVYVHLLDLTN